MGLFGPKAKETPLAEKTWTVMGIVLFCLLIAGVFIYTFNISLLLLAGIVLAVYLRMIADKLKQWTGWKDLVCYIISLLFTVALLVGFFWLVGAKVQDQAEELRKQLPQMQQKVTTAVNKSPIAKKLLGKYINNLQSMTASAGNGPSSAASADSSKAAPPASVAQDSTGGQAAAAQAPSANASAAAQDTAKNTAPSSGGAGPGASGAGGQSGGSSSSSGITKTLTNFFSSTFGLLGDLYAVFFLGVFLAATPREYVNGVVKLLPASSRKKGRDTMERLGTNLRKWFKGTVYSVLITFALTAIGLLILKVDLWLILALIAGLLTFVPNFGPIIALIPAVMVGFLQGPQQALWIAVLYFLVQLIESNIITPLIQKKMLDTPAALLLFFQMLMGAISSGWGVVMATPLLVILMTLVQELYTGRVSGDKNEEDSPPEDVNANAPEVAH